MMLRRRDFLGPWLAALIIAALVAAGLPPGLATAFFAPTTKIGRGWRPNDGT